jgi:hypothetical protein
LPALHAAESSGHARPAAIARERGVWRFAMIDQGPWLRAGKSKGSGEPEHGVGFFALLTPLVTDDGRVVYARAFERLASASPKTWTTQALLWAALLAPDETREAAPDVLTAFDERAGAYLFHRHTGSGAVDVALIGGFPTEVPTVERIRPLSLSIRAFGTLFAGGKTSALHVDGQLDKAANTWPQAVIAAPGQALVVLDALPLFRAGQLTRARRTVLVDLDGPAAAPVWVVTRDEVRAAGPRRVTWQIAPEILGVSAETAVVEGRATFTLRQGTAFLRGWVLHPRDARVDVRGAVTVKATAATTDLWIALLAGNGTAPAGRIIGEGLDTVLRVDDDPRTIAFDRDADRPLIRP